MTNMIQRAIRGAARPIAQRKDMGLAEWQLTARDILCLEFRQQRHYQESVRNTTNPATHGQQRQI
jgi:hypothetical protein